MQRILLLTVLFLCGFTVSVSCEKDKNDFHDQFEKSRAVWEAFKESSNNSYTYTTVESSWVGDSWETTIDVQNGKIVKRSFRYTRLGSIAAPESGWTHELVEKGFLEMGYLVEDLERYPHADLSKIAQWVEEGDKLGEHGNSIAAVLWTLDEIYSFAKESWLKEGLDGKSSFEANNNGMISIVGFVPNNCIDDCFSGVRITRIAAL